MRKSFIVLGVLVAALVLAAPGADSRATHPRMDKLDTERPVAALDHHATLIAWYEAAEAADIEAFLAAAAQAEAEAVAAAAAPAPAPTPTPTTGGGYSDWLACTRAIESGGDYGAISPGGTYRGAYQFLQSTWNSTAASAGRQDLVGVDPAAASPADQDAMALHLFDGGRGASHWGGRCV